MNLPTLRERWNKLNLSEPSYSDREILFDRFMEFTGKSLELGQFVACNEKGEPMEEPIETIGGVEIYAEEYQKAQDKVLFKGWKIERGCLNDSNRTIGDMRKGRIYFGRLKTIEDLLKAGIALELSDNLSLELNSNN